VQLDQMININFIASNRFHLDNLKDVQSFVNSFPDFQTIVLKTEEELNILLRLMGIEEIEPQELNNSDFSKYWDCSNFKLPELDEKQFEQFYKNWLKLSNRENNMDEYGNLIFLQGLSKKWNELNYRIIAKEI
jgi:hypothetical protein